MTKIKKKRNLMHVPTEIGVGVTQKSIFHLSPYETTFNSDIQLP